MARLLPAGERAVLLDCADLGEALGLHSELWDRERPPGLVEAVLGARTLLLVATSPAELDRVRAATERLLDSVVPQAASAGSADHRNVVEVPVRYDGPDLADVARLTGLSEDDVVRAHTGTEWTVGFGGFAPGFAYLVDGDPRLDVPRRSTPRPRVEAGSVGLAGPFSGVYPRASPGGWQILGHTDLPMWDLSEDPPARLRPGMRVRFVDRGAPPEAAVPASEPHQPHPDAVTPRSTTGVSLEVLATGPLTLVQDAGRPGLASLGVSPSGAADHTAYELGARLLGHGAEPAALECLQGGLALRAVGGGVTVVLTGSPAPATVDGRPVGHAAPFLLPRGAVLELGTAPAGLRTYVSVRGGIDVEPVLGSRSSDTLSGLGPAALTTGQVLPVGRGRGEPLVDVAPVAPPPDADLLLEVDPGPRHDWLADPAQLAATRWSVDPASDRVGVRLAGPPLARAAQVDGRELPSEGLVAGAVQVPADGQPVVFLADHPVTGGYPVVGVVPRRSLDRLAQARPGQGVRLHWR